MVSTSSVGVGSLSHCREGFRMSDRPFVHLHCHTHYSLLDGANRIPELVARVKSLGMNAVAITDHGNLYGAIEFYLECRKAGINPIIGYEAYIAPGKRTDRSARRRGEAGYHLTLLAKNRIGFKNLIKLSSIAYLEGYHYVPRIDKELLTAHHEGLICLSGCASSEFSELILREQLDEALELARWFARLFGPDFYVEIQNNGLDIQKQCAEGAISIANKLGLPLVATCDAHYLTPDDALAHDVLLCINTGQKLRDENRLRYGSDQFYVRAPAEMYQLFPQQHEAVLQSQRIADRVNIDLDLKKRHFPVFVPPEGKSPEEYLRELCLAGVQLRYRGQPSEAVLARLQHELDIICSMGFASYFLIVSDFVRFAVEKGIPCSARGSACGSLVSFVLQLSHVDPLEYDLLFERFLDPSRSEAPDIDIDFCQERREEVIAYVRHKYGAESVAQIATFGTLAARAAIKDVGRALDVPLPRVSQLAEMVPQRPGVTLDEALKENSDLASLYQSDPEVRRLIDIARSLEGTNRQSGIHAAGVVIADGPLTEHVPLHRAMRKDDDTGAKSGEAVVATQWGMEHLEKVGMLKMDFLGLRTLTLLTNAVRLIEKTRGEKIDIYQLPLDDPETYELLQRGDAKGVFQFESDGIRELLKRLRPDNIRDIIACTALYRPGPLDGGMVDDYVNVKHGRAKPTYKHPVMEEILSETHAVMVYQEQVMRILNKLGGIPLGSAYACIKAISKKKHEIIDAHKVDFVRGAQERGLDKATAEEIFGLIVHFGGYGFNKSHSAAYAFVSYQTAYLKTHYTAEFMAALLSSEIEDGNKRDIMVDHIADARKFGIEVLPPDINTSESDFSVKDNKIVFGLAAIKGVGRASTDGIVAARQARGKFKDLYDFCERIDPRVVKPVAIEKLIKAGALDCFGIHRAQLLHLLPIALQAAQSRLADRRKGQLNMFENGSEPTSVALADPAVPPLPEVAPWSETDRLKYEKEVLDFYFSSHPLAQQEQLIRRYITHSIAELRGVAGETEVIVGGMLTMVRVLSYKKPQRNGNTRYGRCKIEDFSGSLECVMWGDEFLKFKDLFVEDQIVLAKGLLERKTDEPSLQITRLFTLEQAKQEMARELHLLFRPGVCTPTDVDALASILRRSPGTVPVFLTIKDSAGRRCVLRLGRELAINPATYDHDALIDLLGAGCVYIR
jgi:DNA polymerase-3 subunit alpha